MHITVTFVGILAVLIQNGTVEVHLPQEATYGDLLREIWRQFGRSIPDPLWDRQANAFREPIFAMSSGRAIDSPDTPLTDGEEVKFLTLVAGG
jgi:molybdopterin converting factor small subunit